MPNTDRLVERARWLDLVLSVKQWSKGGKRAPHKPLLMLYALGRLQRTGSSASTYVEADELLGRLLVDFGSPRQKPTTAHPFVRLANDHAGALWTVSDEGGVAFDEPRDTKGWLRDHRATGSFETRFERALLADPGLVALVGRALLEEHFAPSLHEDICTAAGLDLETAERELVASRVRELAARRRDPEFRRQVLAAYEFRCAMCGYDGRLGADAVGLDAAHIRWWAFDGPDTVDNGLCLCSFHHKMLDRGVLGVDDSHRVTVSEQFVATGPSAGVLVFDLLGRPIHEPQRGKPSPADDHLTWHLTQVFRGPSRIPA